ncbi:hypothetical protein [Pedobacter sp.]
MAKAFFNSSFPPSTEADGNENLIIQFIAMCSVWREYPEEYYLLLLASANGSKSNLSIHLALALFKEISQK